MSNKKKQLLLNSYLDIFSNTISGLDENKQQKCIDNVQKIINIFSNQNDPNFFAELIKKQREIVSQDEITNKDIIINNVSTNHVNFKYNKPFVNHNEFLKYCICQYDLQKYMYSQTKFTTAIWNMVSHLTYVSYSYIKVKDDITNSDNSYRRMLIGTKKLMVNLTTLDYLKIYGVLFKAIHGKNNIFRKQFSLWLGKTSCFQQLVKKMDLTVNKDIAQELFITFMVL